jgi:hypothetical protein
VNQADVQNQADWITITNGASTWWDLDGDGYTDDDDAQALFDLTANPNCNLGQGQYR